MAESIDRNYGRVFREAAQQRCLEVAEMIAEGAKANAAARFKKGTGHLARGYSASLDGRTSAKITGVPYWADVEFGHQIADRQGRQVMNKNTGLPMRVGQKPHVRPAIEAVAKQLAAGDE